MTTVARFDLKLDKREKTLFARAAELMGTTMAGFVRAAAKEKANALIEREARVTLSEKEAHRLLSALDAPFQPNPALKKALEAAERKITRA
jgi:uncharacterized protein (DUF1778 family)